MKILIFGYGGESTVAVSTILLNLSQELVKKDDAEITFFGYGKEKESKHLQDRIDIVSVKDPFLSHNFSFFRILRKLTKIFKIDRPCLSWKNLYRKSLKIFRNTNFDYVIGASGYFMYMEAAYRFSTKRHIKFGEIYFDPFSNNIGNINKAKRLRIENKWYQRADFVLYESSSRPIEIEDTELKIHKYSIPIFENASELVKDGSVIYGGQFYEPYRSSKTLERFINEDYSKNERFEVYTNSKNFDVKNGNAVFRNLLPSADYVNVSKSAKAIIVIGNKNQKDVVPSKLFEAISYKKPIIGIDLELQANIIGKYPLFYSADDPDVFKKINSLKQADIDKIDIYSAYPERDPDLLVNLFLSLIRH